MNVTDFRNNRIELAEDCQFCSQNIQERIVGEYKSASVIKDKFPVSKDHMLIVPKRHTSDYFSLTQTEKRDADRLIEIWRKKIAEMDSTVTGFNIGINCGESAGQTIFHCHIHLIPRRNGDTPAPRGGVRGVIPEKMGY